jgi:hypothetical protein
MPINEIDIVQTPSGQLVTEIELQQGLPGPPNTLEIGNVTTGVQAAASITGSSPSQLLHLTLPKGNTGTAATIAVGTTTTGAAGSDALVTNAGTNSAAVFDFTIPRGNTGATGTAATIAVGATTTGEAGSSASVTNVGTNSAAVFNFDIPRGNTGATGPATQLSVASTSTGSAGSEASVTISGTAPVQSLAFTIPRGNTGATGPATQLSVASTTTGAAGSNASVTISGDAPNQSLAFTIPTGPQGPQGPTGSSGATAQLTGYVSSPGTVAATDTVIQAVGKLNGNDELKAPIASLYPYIGGKLLTYTDEEAAIADPLISAGDIYRKTAGGVDYVNPDNVPSLDLRFAADKTLTARRGPTPTFTRGSGATYIGSDGLIHGVDTSTTSNTIGTGSRTFTLAATAGQDQFWRTGDAVEASNGANIMAGTVTSYNATTQSLVCNMTTASGSGTFTSWRIGYRGPRFDHNTTSPFACRGLLIEEGRTNALQHSANFKNTTSSNYWENITGTTVTVDQTTSPDGGVNADLLTTSTTAFDCFTRRSGVYAAASTQHTYSIFVKRGPSNYRYVGFYVGAGTGGTGQFPYFDFDNPTIVQLPTITYGTINSTRVDPYPNGWYRISITFTTGATTPSTFAGVFISSSTGAAQSTNPAGNDCYIWGIQSELGSFATSYIPTTTTPLNRSADVCSITGADFTSFYNQSEGTFLLKATSLMATATTGNRTFVSFTDGGYINQQGLYKAANTNNLGFPIGVGIGPTIGTLTAGSPFAVSGAMQVANNAAAFNGAAAVAVTGSAATGISKLEFRDPTAAASGHPTMHISQFRYYKKRLPNAKLQALTV